MSKLKEQLFVEKYRPQTVDECILPDRIKSTFKSFVEAGEMPNMLLSGGPGVGKTTIAKALCNEMGMDFIIINASLDANKDSLRNDIKKFASTVSLSHKGKKKVVILDEADNLSSAHVQPALRGFIEEFSKNCRFIFTCNYKNKIIAPLRDSRLANIDFSITKSEKPALAALFMKRLQNILHDEGIEYEPKVIAELITTYFPDFRRILNEIQRYGISGKIDSGVLANISDIEIKDLVKFLKEKDFTKMRKWVGTCVDLDPASLFQRLYDASYDVMKSESIPMLVLKLADYQYKAAFAVNQEINIVACLTEIMVDCEFK